jgi:predicted aspartyl protease
LLVDIGFDPAFRPGQAALPAAGASGLEALVDTGATESCIDIQLAVQLNLPIINQRSYGGAAGIHLANMYMAQISVPSLFFIIYGEFAGVDLTGGLQTHRALIGRTFLQHFNMTYSGLTGAVTITR